MAESADVGGRPSGTVAFVFTDVEGSTRLWAADKAGMSASLLMHDAILRAAIERNGGYVFATAGDSFAAAFGRASDAVVAAQSAQRALNEAMWPGPEVPRVWCSAGLWVSCFDGKILLTVPSCFVLGWWDVADL